MENDDVIEINIKELFHILVHKWWIIMIFGILGAGCAGFYSQYMVTPIYASTAKAYVLNQQYEDVTTWSDLQIGEYLIKDLTYLIKSRPIMEEVVNELNLNMSSEQLAGRIAINAPEQTRILEITVFDPDPEMAKQLVDMIADISSERLVSVMLIDAVNVLEYGNIPRYPNGPYTMKNVLMGGLIGACLISAIFIIAYLMNDSIKTSEDIEKYLGITTLGSIPLEEDEKRKRHKVKQRKVAVAS